jgi:hypothetical protein
MLAKVLHAAFISLCLSSLAHAATDCSEQGLTKVRRGVEVLHKEKKFDQALRSIEAVEKECYTPLFLQDGKPDPKQIDQYYWLQSEALLAEAKTQKLSACVKRGTEILEGTGRNPFIENEVDKRPPGKALKHNLSLCQGAWSKKYAAIPAPPCILNLKNKAAGTMAIGLPGKEACLRLIGDFEGTPEQREAEEIDLKLCPRVQLVTMNKAQNKIEAANLPADAGALSSCEITCGLSNVQLVKQGEELLVRVTGSTGSCAGGTAAYQYDGVYRLRDKSLAFEDETVAALH